jgi:diacylglycerol O-acyltransferase
MPNRLSLFDASFLTLETETTPLHVGGVAIMSSRLAWEEMLSVLQARLPMMPVARQRLQHVAFRAGLPVWVDDADFDLSYHVRHAALPPPGDRGQLCEFVARIIARPLDRNRPLWELYLVDGFEGGRSVLFRKVHLAMSGQDPADPFAVMLDETPDSPLYAGQKVVEHTWQPDPAPSAAALLGQAAKERAAQAAKVGRGLGHVVRRPGRLVEDAAAAAGSAVGLAARLAGSATASPLNRPLTPHRRFELASADLEDLRIVRRAFGGSINDVVVTVVADAVGRLLRARGHDTTDLDLRLMIPVSVDDGVQGDEIAMIGSAVREGVVAVLTPLPVMEIDPVARLYRVMGELAGLKESRQAVAADQLVRLAGYGPASLHARAARLASAEHRYHVALSNAPGPQTPRWCRGVRLEESYSFIPLAGNSTLSFAVCSYDGAMFFGLLGDRDAVSDIELLSFLVEDAVADLVKAAGTTGR